MLEIVVAEDENDIQTWALENFPFGVPGMESGCGEGRLSWGSELRPEAWSVAWPYTFPPTFGTMSMEADPFADEPKPGNATAGGNHGGIGRGPGAAAPPGQGEGLDREHETGNGRGRGTAETPAPGQREQADTGCETMCACLVDAYGVDLEECVEGCTQLVGSIDSHLRRDACVALFEDLELTECAEQCDAFGGGGGGRR
jgi:hypothetical protein